MALQDAWEAHPGDLRSNGIWLELYPRLRSLARRFVYKYRIPCWRGQEEEIAEDIVQETIKRFIERSRKAERAEATSIDAPEQLMITIAHNYTLDLVRREHRLIHMPEEELIFILGNEKDSCTLMEDVAVESVYDEWLFLRLAYEIAHFPYKQRQALLIDLATRMHFSEQPTPLQAAFLERGIDLREYQRPLPTNPIERGRHASLLSYAYRRLAKLALLQEDSPAA